MDISKLQSLIRVEDSIDSDAHVYIGFIRICSIYEECGRWYPSVQGRELFTLNGFASKQDALDAVVKHLTD
jgi:hypothetical protein